MTLATAANRDLVGGITTFFTMAYIVVVNPAILSNGTGIPFTGALTATVLVASSMTMLMGVYARLPFGVAPGMGLNAALALVPGLRVEERLPAAEAALLDRLGRWALQFTPVVSLEPPGTVLAEVRGSLDLFGGVMALLRRALDGLTANGLSASLGVVDVKSGLDWSHV